MILSVVRVKSYRFNIIIFIFIEGKLVLGKNFSYYCLYKVIVMVMGGEVELFDFYLFMLMRIDITKIN